MYRTIAAFSLCASLFVCIGTHARNPNETCCSAGRPLQPAAAREVTYAPSEAVVGAVVLMSLLEGRQMAQESHAGIEDVRPAERIADVCAASLGAAAASRAGCAQPMNASRSGR